jgi:flavodoxin
MPETTERAGERRILLAYYSRAGENYYYGGRRILEVGNTEVLADMIRQLIGCDVYEIEAADPYPYSYDAAQAWSPIGGIVAQGDGAPDMSVLDAMRDTEKREDAQEFRWK